MSVAKDYTGPIEIADVIQMNLQGVKVFKKTPTFLDFSKNPFYHNATTAREEDNPENLVRAKKLLYDNPQLLSMSSPIDARLGVLLALAFLLQPTRSPR